MKRALDVSSQRPNEILLNDQQVITKRIVTSESNCGVADQPFWATAGPVVTPKAI